MNKSLSNLWSYANRHAYPILFILFALWMCIGIFPLVCYETDSQELILGCDLLYYQGWAFPPIHSYKYEMQPLTIITVTTLKYLMTFLTCEQIYCLLTALSSFIFLIGCIEFARHITEESRTKILIAAMLLPEMYAIAMYPNSAIPAAACFIWAFLNIIRERHWLAILLMCIAPLFRVDVVIVYPAILPLLLFEGGSWKKSLLLSAIYCILIVIIDILLLGTLKADILNILHGEQGFDYWNNTIGDMEIIIAILGFYSLSYFILLPIGVFRMFKKEAWKELFLILLPIVILHFVYHSMGCASKHYLYIAPFVIIAGVRALWWIKELLYLNKCLKWVAIVVTIVFYTLSMRIFSLESPWRGNDPKYNKGLFISIYTANMSNNVLSVGIGAGQCIPTKDECLLISGQLFYSWYIHSYKSELEDSRKKLKAALDTIPSSDIVTAWWAARAPILSMYLSESQHQIIYNRDRGYFSLENNNRHLTIWQYVIDKEDSYLLPNETYILVNRTKFQFHLDSLSQEGKVERITDCFYKIKMGVKVDDVINEVYGEWFE